MTCARPDAEAFIRANVRVASAPMLPKIALYRARQESGQAECPVRDFGDCAAAAPGATVYAFAPPEGA